MDGKTRVQFDFSKDALTRLDYIKLETQAVSRAEVVRNALRLYEWFCKEVRPSEKITIILDDESEARYTFPTKLLFD